MGRFSARLWRSFAEDRWERCLNVAHVGGHRRGWSRFRVVRGLELRRLYLALDDSFASDGFLGVFFIIGERANSLVITGLGRVRWFEGSVMLDSWRSLGLGGPVRKRDVLSNNVLV